MSPFGVSTMTRASPRPIAYALALSPGGVVRPTAIEFYIFCRKRRGWWHSNTHMEPAPEITEEKE